MTASIPVFEKTYQKSNEWINELAAELHTQDRQYAYRVLRGVLHALRDRLVADEAAHLGAQLPMLLRGLYYEGWRPSAPPNKDDLAEFLARVQDAVSDQPGPPDPERWIRAVFQVLAHRVDGGEIQDVVGVMPKALVALWPETVRA